MAGADGDSEAVDIVLINRPELPPAGASESSRSLFLARLPPLSWTYFCPAWLPKSLVPEEVVIGSVPARFDGMLEPSATPVSPISASAVS